MQMVMDWLGHQDSRMVRYYYHLADQRSQDEMKRLTFVNTQPVTATPDNAVAPDLALEPVAAGA